MASIFLELVCSVYAVTNTTGVNYSFRIFSKSGFFISAPSIFSTYSNNYNRLFSYEAKVVLYFLEIAIKDDDPPSCIGKSPTNVILHVSRKAYWSAYCQFHNGHSPSIIPMVAPPNPLPYSGKSWIPRLIS